MSDVFERGAKCDILSIENNAYALNTHGSLSIISYTRARFSIIYAFVKSSKRYFLKAHAVSDVGGRKNNEDAHLIDEGMGLFIVADGMGGHDKGEVASWFTSESLERIVTTLKQGQRDETLDEVTDHIKLAGDDDLLVYAVMRINRRLYVENEKELAKVSAPPGSAEAEFAALTAKRRRMGTTLISLLVRGGRAWLTHVGDSRAYRISNDSIQLLTYDHTRVAERIRSGEITSEQAKVREKRNIITRSVGFKRDVEADIDVLTIHPPERFLLCSDGLSNVVDEKNLLALARTPDISEACESMVELAKKLGGLDNITAMLVDISTRPESVPVVQHVHGGLREFTEF